MGFKLLHSQRSDWSVRIIIILWDLVGSWMNRIHFYNQKLRNGEPVHRRPIFPEDEA